MSLFNITSIFLRRQNDPAFCRFLQVYVVKHNVNDASFSRQRILQLLQQTSFHSREDQHCWTFGKFSTLLSGSTFNDIHCEGHLVSFQQFYLAALYYLIQKMVRSGDRWIESRLGRLYGNIAVNFDY